jgi:hypothetical protein
MKRYPYLALFALCTLCLAYPWLSYMVQDGQNAHGQQPAQNQPESGRGSTITRQRPLASPQSAKSDSAPAQPPQDGVLYVWQTPERGPQTILVLRVTGPDTADCAFLVPFRLKQKGLPEQPPSERADPKQRAQKTTHLEQLIGGRLLAAQLDGSNQQGEVLADIWLGTPDSKNGPPNGPTGWLSQHLVK